MKTQAAGAVAPPYPAAIVVANSNWHSPLVQSGPVPLIHPEIIIGRLASSDIVLSDPAVSRQHAAIRWTEGGYEIADLGSRSGTFVDGRAISGPTLLQPGERIRLGGTELAFLVVRTDPDGRPTEMNTSTRPPQAGQPSNRATGETSMSLDDVGAAVNRALDPALKRWFEQQRSRWYWRVAGLGLLAYLASWQILQSTGNPHLAPLVILLASALVPVTFVIFCWEQGAFSDLPATVLGRGFVGGATLGLLLAAVAEQSLVPGTGFGQWLMVGLIEETAKAAVVYWLLTSARFGEFDGLVLGAAVGMGFAALETAGYGFSSFLGGFLNAYNYGLVHSASVNQSANFGFTNGLQAMIGELNLRMELALFGHGVWTAIIGAALGRERQGAKLRITAGAVLAYGVSVLLHALWDANANSLILDLIDGAGGLIILGFFLQEGLRRAKLGVDGGEPPALAQSLGAYLVQVFRRSQRPVARVMEFAGAAAAIPQAGGAAGAPRFCLHCGIALPAPAQFCPSCGTRVPRPKAETPEAIATHAGDAASDRAFSPSRGAAGS